ncbi:unnamed protein product [Enterobius vermicularis]|uniref:Uncharacterized protein n=1 Tax=Enterobius vermicularis TaxID=51028 RepID=A0A0N4VQH3_ENTVE|nr:unnamed protein product [Enterobius vermicularis]
MRQLRRSHPTAISAVTTVVKATGTVVDVCGGGGGGGAVFLLVYGQIQCLIGTIKHCVMTKYRQMNDE